MTPKQIDSTGKLTDRGFNMHTVWGDPVYPLGITEDDVEITVIAHSLSMQNRFLGHTKFPYSVAQHSIYMSHFVPPEHALEALLHDAAETYCGDLIRPIKYSPELSGFKSVEARIDRAIRKKFSLPETMSQVVKEADVIMAWTERRDVLFPSKADWGDTVDPYPDRITEQNWLDVRFEFTKRYLELKK